MRSIRPQTRLLGQPAVRSSIALRPDQYGIRSFPPSLRIFHEQSHLNHTKRGLSQVSAGSGCALTPSKATSVSAAGTFTVSDTIPRLEMERPHVQITESHPDTHGSEPEHIVQPKSTDPERESANSAMTDSMTSGARISDALKLMPSRFAPIPTSLLSRTSIFTDADFITPAPGPEPTQAQILIHKAKCYFRFYWNAVKVIISDAKLARSLTAQSMQTSITWRDVNTIRTSQKDMERVVPFVLIALVLEEAILAIAYFCPGFLPSTCILPSQTAKMASAAQSKRMKAINTLRDDPSNALAACRLFNLSTIGPEFFRRRRLQRYFSDLDYDHGILTRMLSDNKLSQLNLVEMLDVLARFGISLSDHSEQDLEEILTTWLRRRQDNYESYLNLALDLSAKNSGS